MNRSLLSLSVLAAAAFAAAAADPATHAPTAAPEKPGALAAIERTTALYDRYGASFVEVAWKLRLDEEGRAPMRAIPYRCPNCGNIHYHSLDSVISENRAFTTPGFVLAPDRVLAYDPKIRTSGVERVEIRLPGRPGEAWPARAVASYPEQGALLFATEEPLPGAKPLEFAAAGRLPDEPSYFFVAREDAQLTTGVRTKPVDAFTRFLDTGRDYAAGVANALLLNASNEAVTVSFDSVFEVGGGCFAAPSDWTPGEPDAAEREAAALEARLARAILPVFLRLDPKAQEEREGGGGRRVFYSSDDEDSDGDEKDLSGTVFAGGRVMIPSAAGADEIARLDKLEATLPDGTKAPLRFVGALKDYRVLVAEFEGGVPAGVEPVEVAAEPVLSLYRRPALEMDVEVQGESVRLRAGHLRLDELAEGRDDLPVFGGEKDLYLPDGRLVQWTTNRRQNARRWGSETDRLNGAKLAAFAAGELPLDPEIVPRKGKDRIRVAWFGADLQSVTREIAREKKATAWLGTKRERQVDTRGALVSHVYPGGAAERIGVKEGDILLFARSADGLVRRAIETERYETDAMDWEEIYDKAPLQLFDRIPFTPWPAIGNPADEAIGAFGIGAKVGVEWVSDGALRQAEFTVEVAPPHFRTATRARSKALGVIVADVTFEVREYFKLEEGEGGVVVTRCKAGSPAAIAGLRPFELVTKVDDVPVADARAFLDAVRGKESPTLTVRRLTKTRVVKVSTKATPEDGAAEGGAPGAESADEGADEPDAPTAEE